MLEPRNNGLASPNCKISQYSRMDWISKYKLNTTGKKRSSTITILNNPNLSGSGNTQKNNSN